MNLVTCMVDAGAVSPDRRLIFCNHGYNTHVLFWMNTKSFQINQTFQCLRYSPIIYIIHACLPAKNWFVLIPFAELCTILKFPNVSFLIIQIINTHLVETFKIIQGQTTILLLYSLSWEWVLKKLEHEVSGSDLKRLWDWWWIIRLHRYVDYNHYVNNNTNPFPFRPPLAINMCAFMK